MVRRRGARLRATAGGRGVRARVAALVLACSAVSAFAGGTPPPEPALARIEAAGLRARIRFLSHDLLEGRTDRGYDIAATWVATQLEGIGFSPAGENGTWFQDVPLARARVEALPLTVDGRGGSRTILPPHVLMGPGAGIDTLDVDAEVVFAGYGIQAQRLGRDDYRHLDVRGKVVVVLANTPESFPSDDRAHHVSLRPQEDLAAAHGVTGPRAPLSTWTAELPYVATFPWDPSNPPHTSFGLPMCGVGAPPFTQAPYLPGPHTV